MTSWMLVNSRLIGTALLLSVSICWQASAQDKNSAFHKLRELPALGACPADGFVPDPDLRKALVNAVTQARVETTDALKLVARMKDSGLASADSIEQLNESAHKLSKALKDPDPCVA